MHGGTKDSAPSDPGKDVDPARSAGRATCGTLLALRPRTPFPSSSAAVLGARGSAEPVTPPAPAACAMAFSQSLSDLVAAAAAATFLFLLLKAAIARASASLHSARERAVKVSKKGTRILVSQFKVDAFFKRNGYSWDYVIAMPVHHKNDPFPAKQKEYFERYSLRNVVEFIAAAGLEAKLEWSTDFKHVLVNIRGSQDRLRTEADRIDYEMPLSPEPLKSAMAEGKPGVWNGRKYDEERSKEDGLYNPFQFIYAPYDTAPAVQSLFETHPPSFSIFKSTDRVKLIVSILRAQRRPSIRGAGLNLSKLDSKGVIDSHFPLHLQRELEAVQGPIMNMTQMPWNMPIDRLRDYFGEKVGMYFAWVSHYTTMLMVAAVAGLATWVDVFLEDTPNAALVLFFAIFMSVWSAVFVESWKRRQVTLAMKWGMTNFEESEQERPSFLTHKRTVVNISPVTSMAVPVFPDSVRRKLVAISATLISIAIIAVAAIVSGIFILKTKLVENPWVVSGLDLGSIVPSVLNSLQIQVTNFLYQKLALWLNDFENHRTDTEYEDYLIAKTFAFQFINSYASLIYIAFFKDNISDDPAAQCVDRDCMRELSVQLGTILLMRLVVDNFVEIGVPFILGSLKRCKKGHVNSPRLTAAEQFELAEYDVLTGTFEDYSELVIQFGYATMFAAAFPLAPVVALVANWIELRVDGFKLCTITRRPQPVGQEDIGTWLSILQIMSAIGTAFNIALFCFTGDFELLRDKSMTFRFILFICLEHAMLFIQYVIAEILPDVPRPVAVQMERGRFMVEKVFRNSEDEDDDDLASGIAGVPADLSISVAVNPYDVLV